MLSMLLNKSGRFLLKGKSSISVHNVSTLLKKTQFANSEQKPGAVFNFISCKSYATDDGDKSEGDKKSKEEEVKMKKITSIKRAPSSEGDKDITLIKAKQIPIKPDKAESVKVVSKKTPPSGSAGGSPPSPSTLPSGSGGGSLSSPSTPPSGPGGGSPPSPSTLPSGAGGGSLSPPSTPPSGAGGGSPPTLSNRPQRLEPEPVIWCLIPRTWPESLYSRTGATGFSTFCFTCGIFFMSKEILVMEHEYYGGLSMGLLCWATVVYVGPAIAKGLDKEIDAIEHLWNTNRVNDKKILEDSILQEQQLQFSSEGQLLLLDAKRENVKMQLEANFRERKMIAYTAVKRRLDYQVAKYQSERRLAHLNMIDWVTKQVLSSITPEEEKKNIDQCISDLEILSQRYAAVV